MEIPLDRPFIRSTEKLWYVPRLVAIMVRYADLRDEEVTTHSLNYFDLLRPFNIHHLLTNFEYRLNETVFERCLCLKSTHPLFANWHCVDYFNILPARCRELFDKVIEWWKCSECSRLLYVLTPVVLAYYSIHALFGD